ncbi:hypothetical protein Hanom_Chr01g00075641 [Helianthus anomalus]
MARDKWQEQWKLSSHEFSTKVLRDFTGVTFRKKKKRSKTRKHIFRSRKKQSSH